MDPILKGLIKRTAIGTTIGAAAGGFSGSRLQKRKAKKLQINPYTGKVFAHRHTTASGAALGALTGGTVGLTHGLYAPHLSPHLKDIKRMWRDAGTPFKERREDLLGAAAGGLGFGSIGYIHGKKREKDKAPTKRSDRWAEAAMAGAMGAGYGHMFGAMARGHRLQMHQIFHHTGEHRTGGFGTPSKTHAPPPKWAKGAKTKAEAKKRYRAEAKKHHPDIGGDPETMKKVNTEWEAFENSSHFDKLAHLMSSIMVS